MKALALVFAFAALALFSGCASMLSGTGAERQIRAGVAWYKEQSPEVKAVTKMNLDETLKPCKLRLWCPGDQAPDVCVQPVNSTP